MDKDIIAAIITLGILPKTPPVQANREAAATEAVRCFYTVRSRLDMAKEDIMKPPDPKPRE